MKRKTIAYVLSAFFFLTAFAYAQKWPSVDNIVAKIQIELNLGREQLDQVKLIIEENMAKRQQVEPQMAGLTQTQSQPFDAELYQKLSGVLTRSQMNQWNKVLTSMLEEMDANSGG